MKGLGIFLVVTLVLVLLAIQDTESVSLIDRLSVFEGMIRQNARAHGLSTFFYARRKR